MLSRTWPATAPSIGEAWAAEDSTRKVNAQRASRGRDMAKRFGKSADVLGWDDVDKYASSGPGVGFVPRPRS